LGVRDASGRRRDVLLLRSPPTPARAAAQYRGAVLRLLKGNIGYADLTRLTVPQVDSMFEMFKNTRAIIFDMRGYPNGTAWAIAPRLAVRPGKAAAILRVPMRNSPDTAQRAAVESMQLIPTTDKPRYTGRTVMLIDERAISQSEHTGLFFEAANGTKFVGTPTAGANGDVTNVVLPGDIVVNFTGLEVRHADGRQLQRVGLKPDITAKPTIAGLRAGRDEVLDAAVRLLGGPTPSAAADH
jgi:C-terminal processing protease CtpA/Prc